ncbi:MAG: terpene cyclase/mutase family protein [Planctomycetes bacterium]|nr:terpene cyclase/mutase family protein [Planctomycetota bacterium]
MLVLGVLAAIVAITPARGAGQISESTSGSVAGVEAPEFTETPLCRSKKKVAQPTPTLDYIRDLQQADGSWDSWSIRTNKRKGTWSYGSVIRCDNEHGYETDRVANTSLALLMYTDEGYDHIDGPFKSSFKLGLKYLQDIQTDDGLFSDNVRHHSLATMALGECYMLSGDDKLKSGIQKGIDALLKLRKADIGFGEGDTSNVIDSAYAILAMKSGKMSGLSIEISEVVETFKYIDSLRDEDSVIYSKTEESYPQYGNKLKTPMPICEAAWLFAALMSGEVNIADQRAKAIAKKLTKAEYLPDWKANNVDVQYYYFASLALFQIGGDYWNNWEVKISKQLLDNQRGNTKLDKEREMTSPGKLLDYGSWDPVGVNGSRYGRVYTTAMCNLSLQIWYRYQRATERDKGKNK